MSKNYQKPNIFKESSDSLKRAYKKYREVWKLREEGKPLNNDIPLMIAGEDYSFASDIDSILNNFLFGGNVNDYQQNIERQRAVIEAIWQDKISEFLDTPYQEYYATGSSDGAYWQMGSWDDLLEASELDEMQLNKLDIDQQYKDIFAKSYKIFNTFGANRIHIWRYIMALMNDAYEMGWDDLTLEMMTFVMAQLELVPRFTVSPHLGEESRWRTNTAIHTINIVINENQFFQQVQDLYDKQLAEELEGVGTNESQKKAIKDSYDEKRAKLKTLKKDALNAIFMHDAPEMRMELYTALDYVEHLGEIKNALKGFLEDGIIKKEVTYLKKLFEHYYPGGQMDKDRTSEIYNGGGNGVESLREHYLRMPWEFAENRRAIEAAIKKAVPHDVRSEPGSSDLQGYIKSAKQKLVEDEYVSSTYPSLVAALGEDEQEIQSHRSKAAVNGNLQTNWDKVEDFMISNYLDLSPFVKYFVKTTDHIQTVQDSTRFDGIGDNSIPRKEEPFLERQMGPAGIVKYIFKPWAKLFKCTFIDDTGIDDEKYGRDNQRFVTTELKDRSVSLIEEFLSDIRRDKVGPQGFFPHQHARRVVNAITASLYDAMIDAGKMGYNTQYQGESATRQISYYKPHDLENVIDDIKDTLNTLLGLAPSPQMSI